MSARKKYVVLLVLAALAVTGAWSFAMEPTDRLLDPLAPDVIYHNGKVVTVNANFDIMQAVAVKGDRILAVGSNEEVRALAGPTTRLVDLQGRTMLPGIYDNHIHIGASADTAQQNWTHEVHTIEELEAALRRRAAEVGPNGWVLARLARFYWPNDAAPDRTWLDRVIPNQPVAIERGHLMMLNSMALARAGITRETPNPGGGWIVHDEAGEPTGHLYETPAKRLVYPQFPKSPPLEREKAMRQIRDHLIKLRNIGYTSVNVPGVRPEGLGYFQDVYERWGEELPRLTVQVRISPGYDMHDDLSVGAGSAKEEIDRLAFRTGFGNDRLKIGSIKLSIDGGVSAPSNWTVEPYRDDFRLGAGFTGVIRIPEETLYDVGKHAHDLGWQLGIHAIGDAATVMAVNVLKRILQEAPRDDHRHYLHHVSVKPPEATIRTMAEYDITVASQPAFNYWLGSYLVEQLDPVRLETNNPQASLLRAGVRVTHGTDDDHDDPWVVIWSAVTRTGWGDVQRGAEQEAMTLQEAIRAITIESAWMTFDEDNRGSLEPGKYADLVVLHDDIMTVDPMQIRDVRVARTVIGGKEVFEGVGTVSRGPVPWARGWGPSR